MKDILILKKFLMDVENFDRMNFKSFGIYNKAFPWNI